ncbi:MAG: hypothetical protein EAZ65_00615 [Verrucomicrobia bacterium]|nr:MAG: hypothetical protein EAZ84_05450 [Verrucomicrobiota bacterium]TAE89284.1 MAG: hypothetical protein EAZ82_01280 [Verrucomicrobiota bacterium]TAF27842.1 MAG: hypothetical protein EAZ71_00620 [Verrucomicrobiota bacterium]TAF42691.1 MAG: hypothetical protein EAZ65_00615 [Verrucomicrobiota bacterium]
MTSFRNWWSVLPASALVFSSCGKKEQESAGAAPGEVAAVAAADASQEEAAPTVKALTPGQRAAMLGIVGRLSKDTESVMAIYDGREIVNRLKSLKAWQLVREIAQEEGEADPEEEIAEPAEVAGKFIGQEIFIATGKGTTPQFANLIQLNKRSNYYQMRVMVEAFASATKSGELSDIEDKDSKVMEGLAKELGKEMGLLESAMMPPILLGLKASDAETLAEAQQNLAGSLDSLPIFMPEGLSPIEFTKGGVDFKGYKLAGTFIADQVAAAREEIEKTLEAADVDRMIEALKTKNLVLAHGSFDNYLMVYLGDSEEGCPLVEKLEDSLAANDDIAFVDGFEGKKLAGFVYGEQGIAKAAVVGSLNDLALGVRDGLAETDAFGDTRELASLLEMIGEKESALLSLAKTESLGGLIVLEDGVKFELFGGTDRGAIDHAASHQLAGLGSGEDVLLFSNWVATPEYSKRARAYGEVVIETAYSMLETAAGLDFEDSEEFAQFKQGFTLFNESFRSDAVGLWDAMATADSGLGGERALVVDLKGSLPPIPGMPQELVDGGRFVRASMLAPVTDRAKLSESWEKLDGSLKNVFKTVSAMTGEEIPMQKPISSEKNGLMTYFFSFPFFNDEFLPSITVGDKWFIASSSKTQALELASAAEKAAGPRKGAWLELDFDVLREFAGDWLDLVEKNGEAILGGEEEVAEFEAQLPRIRKGLAALEEMDQLSVSERREGGRLRTSLHIKTR